jgi:hypothetical protein
LFVSGALRHVDAAFYSVCGFGITIAIEELNMWDQVITTPDGDTVSLPPLANPWGLGQVMAVVLSVY